MPYYNLAIQSRLDQLWDLVSQNGFDPIMSLKYISCLLDIKHLNYKRKKEQNERGEWNEFVGYLDRSKLQSISVWERLDYFLAIYDEELIIRPKDIESSRLTPELLLDSVYIVDSIYEEIEGDEKTYALEAMEGFVYDQLLNRTALLGKRGQFRTPRHITKLMVELLQAQEKEEILDPVCGTGGFLIDACQNVIKNWFERNQPTCIEKDEDGLDSVSSHYSMKGERWNLSVTGFDNDDTMVKFARMNFRMHGLKENEIRKIDTLLLRHETLPKADVILANPPFGIRVQNWRTNRREASEALFIEQIFSLLRPEGRAAVVVPEGVVFNKDRIFKEIRKTLVKEYQLNAVISLPAGTIVRASTKSSSIFVFN